MRSTSSSKSQEEFSVVGTEEASIKEELTIVDEVSSYMLRCTFVNRPKIVSQSKN